MCNHKGVVIEIFEKLFKPWESSKLSDKKGNSEISPRLRKYLLAGLWLREKRRIGLGIAAVVSVAIFLLLLGQLLGQQQYKPLIPPDKPDYEPVKREVAQYLGTLQGTYAVYFKDLASGQTFGINETLALPPASSIKLPVVLYLYQQVAAKKVDWRDRVRYQEASDYQGGAGDLQFAARDGDTYSLRCLATISVILSDNIAHNMLVRHLGYENVMNFIKGIGPETTRPFGSASTNARAMGAFLEEAVRFSRDQPALGARFLNDLSHTIYHVGLPGKLPPDLQVAHKEGSIIGVATDIGIVFGKRPYILVVMSQGIPDEDTGFRSIAEISQIIYNYQQKLPAAPDLGIPEF